MFIKDLKSCTLITAGDNTSLRQILHPENDHLEINYSFAHAIVKSGETSYRHKLSTSEVYYILEGEGLMHIDGETCPVKPQQAVFIPPNADQCITCTSAQDLFFLCIVDPCWKKENEIIY
jgi:mannose-6-phosphate isomerase-like protein (cupin superfamily)